MPSSPLRSVLLWVAVFSLFCGLFGTCTASPSIIALQQGLWSGHYFQMRPFDQGQLVGRVIGGPCTGILCGMMVGGIVGMLARKI